MLLPNVGQLTGGPEKGLWPGVGSAWVGVGRCYLGVGADTCPSHADGPSLG